MSCWSDVKHDFDLNQIRELAAVSVLALLNWIYLESESLDGTIWENHFCSPDGCGLENTQQQQQK